MILLVPRPRHALNSVRMRVGGAILPPTLRATAVGGWLGQDLSPPAGGAGDEQVATSSRQFIIMGGPDMGATESIRGVVGVEVR
jgi:hypothetical protein